MITHNKCSSSFSVAHITFKRVEGELQFIKESHELTSSNIVPGIRLSPDLLQLNGCHP